MIAGRIPIWTLLSLNVLLGASSARATPGAVELSAGGGYARRMDGRREYSGLVMLSLPLDRMARPKLPRASGVADPSDKRPSGAKTDDAPSAPTEPTNSAPAAPLLLSTELAQATLRAAFRAAGRPDALRRFSGLAGRARASAILPELRLRAARTTDESLRLAPTTSDPYRYTQAGGVSLVVEARATWRFDRLVFADEEIQIEQLRRLRARQDARLADEVLKALFAWQRALFALGRADSDPDGPAAAELRLLEAEVRLDVLTGGWFSARLARFGEIGLAKRRASE